MLWIPGRTIWGDPKGHLAECLPLTVFVHIIPHEDQWRAYDECTNGIKSGMYSSTAFRTLQMLLKTFLKSTLTTAWLDGGCLR